MMGRRGREHSDGEEREGTQWWGGEGGDIVVGRGHSDSAGPQLL